MDPFLVLVIIVVIGFVIAVVKGNQRFKDNLDSMESKGYRTDSMIDVGKYLTGHPDLDNAVNVVCVFPKDDNLDLFDSSTLKMVNVATIKKESVKNVLVEDQTTIEKRVTVARLLLTGIFAFALKKKQVNELAYLILEWGDGRFNHETIFEFEGRNAITRANTARNQLIKVLR
jgi:hypothetical protein